MIALLTILIIINIISTILLYIYYRREFKRYYLGQSDAITYLSRKIKQYKKEQQLLFNDIKDGSLARGKLEREHIEIKKALKSLRNKKQ